MPILQATLDSLEARTGLVEAGATRLAQSCCIDLQASGLVEARTFFIVDRPPAVSTRTVTDQGHDAEERDDEGFHVE